MVRMHAEALRLEELVVERIRQDLVAWRGEALRVRDGLLNWYAVEWSECDEPNRFQE